jgi:preprotein translocase subunit SecE
MGTAVENATAQASDDSFMSELLSARLYKPSQGRMARQITGGAIFLAFAIGAWRWYSTNYGFGLLAEATTQQAAEILRYVLPTLVLLAGVWIGYRTVNYPRFADFLIAVEAEMNKVMWPSQDELVRSSLVVIALLIAFAVLMFAFDFLWVALFEFLGIRA